MRFVDILICTSLLSLPQAWAALPSDATNAMSFFRDKKSLFPSGQASRQALAKKIIQQDGEDSYQIRLNQRDYLVSSDNLVRDIHLSRFVTNPGNLTLFSAPNLGGHNKGSIPHNSILEVLQIKSEYAQVQTPTKLQGWVRLKDLATRHDDTGIFLSSEHIKVFSAPDKTSFVVGELAPLARIIPIEISQQYVKFVFSTQIAYAPLEKLVSRADFAALAYHSKTKWKYLNGRQKGNLLATDKQIIPLEEVKGYVTDTSKGIYLRAPNRHGLPIINAVQIIQKVTDTWNLSEVSGHGRVWWKDSHTDMLKKSINSKNTILTEDLVKRKIFSIAFSDKNPNIGLASANGLFRTEDGVNWARLESFKEDNLPVAIHPNGTWFAGHYRSNNNGQTFEPFIRWDKLATTIQLNTSHNPQMIKITDIQPLSNSRVQIEVDVGLKKHKLKSLIGDLHWEMVRK